MEPEVPHSSDISTALFEKAVSFGDLEANFLTAKPQPDADPAGVLADFTQAAAGAQAVLLDPHLFLSGDDIAGPRDRVRPNDNPSAEPVVRLTSRTMSAPTLTGAKAWSVAGCDSSVVRIDGKRVGRVFEDRFARYCLLTNLCPEDLTATRTAQAQSLFDRMTAALASIGLSFADVVRTWLYVDRILDWYDELNVVRNAFFQKLGVVEQRLPASTGVGAANASGAALVASVLAVQPKRPDCRVKPIPSPLQCPAPDYKSAFSRAIELTAADDRLVMISGTASIEPGGKTMHVGDMPGQIEQTMRVIRAILTSRGMDWQHVVRGVAYFKDISQTPLLDAWLDQHGLSNLPLTRAHCDICRDDLLFEVELDAARSD